jgi:capsular exopolysaccharide synthesis family protein
MEAGAGQEESGGIEPGRHLESHAKFLESTEFAELVAEQAILEQMAEARQFGPRRIWPGLDGTMDTAIAAVRPAEVVTDPANQTLQLSFRSGLSEQAESLAEMVPRLYVQLDKARSNRQYTQVRNFIRKKLRDFQEREKELIQRVWILRGSANAYQMGEDARALTEKILAQSAPGQARAEASLEEYQEHLAQLGKFAPEDGENPEVDASLLLEGAVPFTPLDSYHLQVAEAMRLEKQLDSLEQSERALSQDFEESFSQTREIAALQQELARLDSESGYFRQLRQTFHNKLQELEFSIELEREKGGSAAIVDRVERKPRQIVQSNLGRHFKVWGLFGLFVGIVLAYFIDFNDTSIKTESEARRQLGTPLLASIPHLGRGALPALPGSASDSERTTGSRGPFGALAQQIEARASQRPIATLLIASTQVGEGKTAVMMHLACEFAQRGERVLVVDCHPGQPAGPDSQAPRVSTLSDVLKGEAHRESALQETRIPNVWFLSAGDCAAQERELLASDRMRVLVDELSASFDRVILEAPAVADSEVAEMLAPLLDGVLFVVRARGIPGHHVQRALEKQRHAGAHLLGVVLNHGRGHGAQDRPASQVLIQLEGGALS